MTSQDEYDGAAGLRRALSVAAGSPPGTVDPVAARRAGDARARTKTAITTSLAFSLVIFAGLGSIYFAAHRSRPSSLGSDQMISTPFSSPSASTMLADRIYAGFATLPVTAGIPDTLHIGGLTHGLSDYQVTWGDGAVGGFNGLVSCYSNFDLPQSPVSHNPQHTYATAGSYMVIVTLMPGCSPELTTSFEQGVQPDTQTKVPLPRASRSATPSRSVSTPASPSASPSASARPSGSAKPTSTASPSPTVSGSASASPSPYSSASP